MDRKHYIKEWRLDRGMTQTQLAQAMGISRSYYTMIERGDRRYDQPFLEAASAALGCTVADLVGREPGATQRIEALLASVGEAERHRIEAAIQALLSDPQNG